MTASASPAVELRLRDGLAVLVRTVTPDDEDSIWEFLTGLSIDSRRLRFFGVADLRAQAHLGAAGDDLDDHGVLAIANDTTRAGGMVVRTSPRLDGISIAAPIA